MGGRGLSNCGQQGIVNIVCFPSLTGIRYLTSSSTLISCPKRGPPGSQPATLEEERDSYSLSVQGFRSKLCLHIAHTNVEIPWTEIFSSDLNTF